MATFVKTASGRWKAVIRKTGWPTACKTFRIKRDAQDWARSVEDEMVRGLYIRRAPAERMTLDAALARYLAEVTPTKRASTQRAEHKKARPLIKHLGRYSLAALSSELVAHYRDQRLAGDKDAHGIIRPRSNSTVRLELALLSHLFAVAIKEWGIGLQSNPVANIRRPAPGAGRTRRLSPDEEGRLLTATRAISNPMLGWIVHIALQTAMRRSEIVDLRMAQVDLNRRIVQLELTKNGSARNVPLTMAAVRAFEAALANPLRPTNTDLVFFGEPGKDGARRPYRFEHGWHAACSAAGLSDIRFHDLRHEAISRLVEAGLPDQVVAAISGHKSMQMLQRYIHLRAEDLVGRLDAVTMP